MFIDEEALSKTEQASEPREWRTFQLNPEQKARFLIKGINNKAYRIAQERITEHLRLTCGNLTTVENYEETSLAKHMTAISYHLVDDWEGIYSKGSNIEKAFTHDSMATVMKYSGDLGIILHGWILEQASDIQRIFDKKMGELVGKPWSFTDIIQNSSEEKNSNESETSSVNQESSNQE